MGYPATAAIDVRKAQVRKILESRAFRNTGVLKRLLEYLARQAIENHAAELKEYTVGVEAFGKPADYDPQIDSSVRVQAGKLRQKLEEYYREEGPQDELIVELPKGCFKLEFRASQQQTTPPHSKLRWLWVACSLLLLAIASVVYLSRQSHQVQAGVWTPEVEEFWRPFLSTSRPTMVAIGTPMFFKAGNDFFRDPYLNSSDTTNADAELRQVEHAAGSNTISPAFPYTGIGEAEGAFEVERLLLPRNPDLSIRASSQLTWEDIERYNMIFLGPPKYNQQTLDLPVQQDFEINHGHVQNLRPAPGEPPIYEEKWSPDRVHLEEGHALITRLPGLHHTGEMLILAGSSTESTRAAVEFVTRPEYVAVLARQMHTGKGSPQWFQAVIHVKYKSQTPIAMELVAFHALK